MSKIKTTLLNILAFWLAFMFIFLLSGGAGYAYAASEGYSGVLSDLQQDPSFNLSDYPENNNIATIEVIQIAESTEGELYLYTYQPAEITIPLLAKRLLMSLSDNAQNSQLYELSQIEVDGVLAKYKIENAVKNEEKIRHYSITAIYRDYLQGEYKTDNDNEALYKSIPVGKLFTIETTTDGALKYSCIENPVIEIKNPYVDFLSYSTGSPWDYLFGATKYTDIHYIAFTPDNLGIDYLQEADVTYTTQTYHYSGLNDAGYSFSEKSEPQYKTIYGEEETSFAGKYVWKNISTVEEFLQTTELNSTAEQEVKKAQYVIIFLTTSFEQHEYHSFMQGHYLEKDGTKVSDVSILRLKYMKEGICYDVGAIMDISEGDDVAGNKKDPPEIPSLLDYIIRFIKFLANLIGIPESGIIAIIVIILIIILLPILAAIFPAFGQVLSVILKGFLFVLKIIAKGLLFIIKGIIWVFALPFRAIAAIFKDKPTATAAAIPATPATPGTPPPQTTSATPAKEKAAEKRKSRAEKRGKKKKAKPRKRRATR